VIALKYKGRKRPFVLEKVKWLTKGYDFTAAPDKTVWVEDEDAAKLQIYNPCMFQEMGRKGDVFPTFTVSVPEAPVATEGESDEKVVIEVGEDPPAGQTDGQPETPALDPAAAEGEAKDPAAHKPFEDMTKDELEDYARKTLDVELDKRSSIKTMINRIEALQDAPKE